MMCTSAHSHTKTYHTPFNSRSGAFASPRARDQHTQREAPHTPHVLLATQTTAHTRPKRTQTHHTQKNHHHNTADSTSRHDTQPTKNPYFQMPPLGEVSPAPASCYYPPNVNYLPVGRIPRMCRNVFIMFSLCVCVWSLAHVNIDVCIRETEEDKQRGTDTHRKEKNQHPPEE